MKSIVGEKYIVGKKAVFEAGNIIEIIKITDDDVEYITRNGVQHRDYFSIGSEFEKNLKEK